MKVLCFGSINFDQIYVVDHFVNPGETIACKELKTAAGGKGLNQSVALANAGVDTYFAGAIGNDGQFLIDTLKHHNVDASNLKIINDEKTGHAIIQKNYDGNNSIVVYPGTNKSITSEMVDNTLSQFCAGDFLLIQNEINMVNKIISKAKSRNMVVAFNPSPVKPNIKNLCFDYVDYLILNEIEACQLLHFNIEDYCSNLKDENIQNKIVNALREKFPHAQIVLTLGELGSIYASNSTFLKQKAFQVEPQDTTAAGDTFMGYFMASIAQDKSIEDSLNRASRAASLSVTKLGAAQSIPKI